MSKIDVKKPSKEDLDKLNVKSWGTWECDVSVFDWEYDTEETCYILDGHVVVKSDEGETEIKAGDWSGSIKVKGATPRILITAYSPGCECVIVLGEIPEMMLPTGEEEFLLSNIVVGTLSVPFNIRVKINPLPSSRNSE